MIEMWAYIIVAVIWVVIIFTGLIPVIRKHESHKIFAVYAECGIGIMLSIIVLGSMIWKDGDIRPLAYIGLALYVPAAAFVISTFIGLKHKGKPESGWEATTVLIDSGVFRIVRHPLYLGIAIFTFAFILIFQAIPSIILGLVAIFCFWMASRKEDAFNIGKFGDAYREYMKKVPMWNPFKRIFMKEERHG